MIQRSLILSQNFRCNGRRQIFLLEVLQVKIVERRVGHGTNIKWQIAPVAPLTEPPLLLRGGDGASRTYPYADAPLVADWRCIGRLNGDDCHLTSGENVLLHNQGRHRLNAAVRPKIRECQQELISDLQTRATAGIPNSDKQYAGKIVAGKIVCESTNCLADLVAVHERLRAFDAVRLKIRQQHFQFVIFHESPV